MSFLDRREFAPLLAHREGSFRIMFELLERRRKERHVIVETGCLRDPGNWVGDGQSTLMFSAFTDETNGYTYSVDADPHAVAVAKRMCPSAKIEQADSVVLLSRFSTPIDLLYLDSEGGMVPIFELCAASRMLSTGSIVAVDDMVNHGVHGRSGKGKVVADYMERIGAQLVVDDYQMIWLIP